MQKRKSSGAPEWPVPKIVYTINTHFGRDKPRLNTHLVQCCRQNLRTIINPKKHGIFHESLIVHSSTTTTLATVRDTPQLSRAGVIQENVL